MAKYDTLTSILASLSASSGDIEASAVVSTDGLMIASNFPAGMDEDRVGGMTAAMLGMGERAAKELNRGDFEQVYVRGKNGLIIIIGVGADGVLVTICNQKAKLGLIFMDMQRAAAEIAKVL